MVVIFKDFTVFITRMSNKTNAFVRIFEFF